MSENTVVKAILQQLIYSGFEVFRVNAGMVRTEKGNLIRLAPKGVSDIIGIAPDGRFVAIECKFGKNKPTEAQELFIEVINRMGGLACVAWSTDDIQWMIEEVKKTKANKDKFKKMMQQIKDLKRMHKE